MQAWGLIVLLLSKAAGHSADIPDLKQDKAAGNHSHLIKNPLDVSPFFSRGVAQPKSFS